MGFCTAKIKEKNIKRFIVGYNWGDLRSGIRLVFFQA